jgi:hypothetical protein
MGRGMSDSIAYRAGYKYQLAEDYHTTIEIHPPAAVSNRYVRLMPDGQLTIRRDYAWDGPSGPTVDTPSFARGSLVHDALYQLIREGLIEPGHRKTADKILKRMCREDGMLSIRAWWVYNAVRLFGGPAADPANDHPVMRAP